jgi:hypothetical protein
MSGSSISSTRTPHIASSEAASPASAMSRGMDAHAGSRRTSPSRTRSSFARFAPRAPPARPVLAARERLRDEPPGEPRGTPQHDVERGSGFGHGVRTAASLTPGVKAGACVPACAAR